MTHEPAIVTDVFDFLMGDGFVMVGNRVPLPGGYVIHVHDAADAELVARIQETAEESVQRGMHKYIDFYGHNKFRWNKAQT